MEIMETKFYVLIPPFYAAEIRRHAAKSALRERLDGALDKRYPESAVRCLRSAEYPREGQILVVDSDPSVADFTRALHDSGYRHTDIAPSPYDASRIFRPSEHGIVFVDLIVAGLDAFEIVRNLRREQRGSH